MKDSIVILAIDDDRDDLEMLCDAVKEVNSNILCITKDSGQEAIQALKLKKIPFPTMIYIDMNMPGLNGKECLSEIKKIKRLQAIPIILYSTFRDIEKEAELIKLGASMYVQKPTEFKTICSLVLSCLQLFYRGLDTEVVST